MSLICPKLKYWLRGTDGMAATEAAMLLPILLMLLLGTFDAGRAILVNNKVINASQIGADLIARNREVDMTALNESVEGARLALEPFNTQSFGIDIVSLRFDEDNQPEVLWRETRNMQPNNTAVASTAQLNIREGEGMVIVTVAYDYVPTFAGYVLDTLEMQEVAFSRGRRSPTVCPCPGS